MGTRIEPLASSHRRPCPPLYSGRAGYNLETLEGEKTSWPLVVRLRWQLAITRNGCLPALALFLVDVCPFAILSFPGLLCRSEQSRMPLLPFVCSFTCWHVPARSSHAPGTRPGKPRRIWHRLSGILRVALCLLAILRGNLRRNGPLGILGGEPFL